MSAANRRAALGALDRARPLVHGLRLDRPAAELSRALVEGWNHTEVALRSLLGGTTLGGPALVRELSVRGLLTLDQAHSLVNFHAARERAELADYAPASFDLDAARNAFAELERALLGAQGAEVVPGAAPAALGAVPPPLSAASAPPVAVARTGRGIPSWAVIALLALLLIVLPLLGYLAYTNRSGGPKQMAEAQQMYASGNRDAARLAFVEISRANPELALPHVYLGRIAREQGEYSVANQELRTAVNLAPGDPVALREMAALMFATGNFDLARRFYVRTLQADPTDVTAQGFLGCTLVRMGRLEEGARFIQRAGPGAWSACMPSARPGMPGAPAGRVN